ncbi:MAG: MG2 domain-containing protein [Bacteroidia bacterium]|nr:MG2 domain-containing protein [Bacteroidia bacterium]
MLRSRLFLLPAAAAFVMVFAWLFWPKSQSLDSRYLQFDERFSPYISAYTNGEVSRASAIRIRFAEEVVGDDMIGQPLPSSPFHFSPAIKGNAIWEDRRTLIFRPEENLPTGEAFAAEVSLKNLLPNLPKDLNTFPFSFGTPAQQFKVELTSNESYGEAGMAWQKVSGVVKTTDVEEIHNIEAILKAKLPNNKGTFRWESTSDGKEFHFVVDSLPRGDADYSVELAWNGKSLNVENKGTETILIPAKGAFRHLHTYTYGEPEAYLVLEFSEPVARQDLGGLIQLDQNHTKLRFTIDGNRIKVFPDSRLTGSHTLTLNPGIQSTEGIALTQPLRESVVFSETMPEVRLIGEGVIIPNAEKLPFIFESIGLKSIDIRVIKIFEKNIPQFLQVNRLSGSQQLKRVGQPVIQKSIQLDKTPDLDLNTWTRHSLDLAELIHPDPGAIYEIAIGFRKSYAYFRCSTEEEEEAERAMIELDDDWYTFSESSDYSYWDYWYGDYDDRDNPCKSAYYNSERVVRRNIMASDLGIIAKRDDEQLFVSVTNLQTTNPIKGVDLEWYDYQNQLMYSSRTDEQGWARIKSDKNHPPFLLVAKQGKQRGYLRLDDGSALSMSRFDTQGQTYTKGVKGFLYGERGVWRPGDPMYLTFILQDEAKAIPADHPVTLELTDPRGQLVNRQVLTNGQQGFYHFLTKTDPAAPTGNYTARVRVGGSTFEKRIKVETVIPNRMKLGLDFGSALLSSTSTPSGTLSARWLHGAIARNLKADVSVTLRTGSTSFPRFSDYNFVDPAISFSSEEITVFEGKLNEEGLATISPKIKIESDAPGMLNASFVAKVYEPGGAFSVDRFTVPFSPYPVYVGVKTPAGDVARGMLLTDIDHNIDIVTVDEKGNPVNSKVEVTLYKLGWRWWWDQSADNIGVYNGRVSADEIASGSVSTVNGKGVWKMNVAYPEWGRYLVRVKDDQGHASGKIIYIDWPGWAGRAKEGQDGGASMLDFSADKETYDVGDSITLNIPTGNAGRALVTIEAGNEILEAYWVNAKTGTTRFTFAATPKMAPTVYAHVTLLQPHAQTANDLPIRLYGVVPLKIEDPQTHLRPQLAMPSSIRPETDFSLKISEADGKPMTYTVAIVDEGLLGLTRFETPSPWHTFYQREALSVKTWDLFDQVLGAYGGEIKSLLSIGGGADAGPPPGQKAERFKPVVMYLGPFTLKAGETKTHSLHMPNYIGEVRTMVVAGTPEGAYGSTEKSTPVKQPLMVLGTLPRVLGPGETVRLPVTLFAMEDNIKDVKVEVKTGRRMLVNGSPRQTVSFAQTGEKMTTFELAVLSSLGVDHVTITATSGGETAVYETDIEVRAPNPRVTDVTSAAMDPSGSWSQDISPVGMRGTNHGILEVSAIPPLNLGKRLEYLLRYPFGCIEQTTSSVFPLVHIPKLMEVTTGQQVAIDDKIKKAIDRLKLFQLSNGGLAYWPGSGEASEWGSNYAGHFMVEAEKIGYRIPETLMNGWKRFQRDRARDWSAGDRAEQLTQGYRLYLLSLVGAPEIGAMNRFRNYSDLEPVAKWYLAAAYQMAGRANIATELTSNLSMNVSPYSELGGTYGSSWRDQAIVLEVLTRMDQRAKAKPLVDLISGQLSSKEWMSTQTTAYCLVAMARFVGTSDTKSDMQFSYRVNGGEWKKVSQTTPIWQEELADVTKGSIEFRNQSEAVLFSRIVLDGIPERGDTTNASNGLKMKVSYLDLNDQSINPASLEQGSNFVVQVSVTNTGIRDYEELALTQIFPSGWEILNSRLDERETGGDKPEYQDQRDDRVFSFFDLGRGQTKTFRLYLNSSYLGKFYLPTVTVEAMYDNAINARQRGQWVEVINAGAGG